VPPRAPTRRNPTLAGEESAHEAARPSRTSRADAHRAIDLALQGGGSHGAFTWGVLDRLLEEPWLQFDGVSGTSAGALNAAVLATGLAQGGPAGGRAKAQAALRAFWEDVAAGGACFGSAHGGALAPGAPKLPSWPSLPSWPGLPASPFEWNPVGQWMAEFTRLFSPYQFNPLDINPLRDIVRRHVDIDAVKRGALAVFVNATAVRSGRPRIFHRGDLSHDALLASACLPQLFRAVQIAGEGGGEPEPYWDGGFSGNPALWPLIYETGALDLVLVKIDPLARPGTPDTPLEIHDRVNEITFNAGLASEMRAIAFVQKLHREGRIDGGQYKNLRLHMVADEAAMEALPPSSKLDTSLAFLHHLHALGRRTADAWLAGDAKQLGRRSTLDVRRVFLGEGAASPEAAPTVAASAAGERRGRRAQARQPRRR
jgi:NTE family protein